ncbi:MAG: TIGR01459 family HAD-type hydrolase [Magnetococcales bacterium]|nr:TIGR01459 family HAD-type hydrolase [Magnetococcales bacterium]
MATTKPLIQGSAHLERAWRRYRNSLVEHVPGLENRLTTGAMEFHRNFLELAQGFQAILFDAYGVLNRGPQAIPGAVATLAALRRGGRPWLVVSNNACETPANLIAGLNRHGFDLQPAELVTAGMAVTPFITASRWRDRPYHLIGTPDSAKVYAPDPGRLMVNGPEYAGAVEDAEFILLCSDRDYYGGEQQRQVEELMARRPRPVLVGNPDLVAPNAQGDNVWVSGLTADALIQRFGAPLIGLGKPFSPIYQLARSRLGPIPAGRILMVGDTLETDILGGAAQGFATCLTLSGVLAGADQPVASLCRSRGIQPDFVVAAIGAPE